MVVGSPCIQTLPHTNQLAAWTGQATTHTYPSLPHMCVEIWPAGAEVSQET